MAWPLVVFIVKDRVRLRNICVAAIILCLAGRALCGHLLSPLMLNSLFLERFTPLRIDALLLGGFLALTLRGDEGSRIARLALPILLILTALFIFVQGLIYFKTHHFYQPVYKLLWLQTIGYTLIDVFAAALILRAIDPRTLTFRVLNNRWLRRLGQISYGFYVFHDIPHLAYAWIVINVFKMRADASAVTMLLALCGTITLSYLSFRFFESPFLRLKDRFTS